jgi:hypothetical protein
MIATQRFVVAPSQSRLGFGILHVYAICENGIIAPGAEYHVDDGHIVFVRAMERVVEDRDVPSGRVEDP